MASVHRKHFQFEWQRNTRMLMISARVGRLFIALLHKYPLDPAQLQAIYRCHCGGIRIKLGNISDKVKCNRCDQVSKDPAFRQIEMLPIYVCNTLGGVLQRVKCSQCGASYPVTSVIPACGFCAVPRQSGIRVIWNRNVDRKLVKLTGEYTVTSLDTVWERLRII